ncbi:MAG: class I SAM-dependent methyltransferase [Candidatus Aminicenantes bacterium]|nr:class I SAM-dependent methyltransferase [Candidatus Aminicenantes bacterium]
MNKDIIDHFERSWKEYDEWYETHPAIYQSELAALAQVIPSGAGLEIGVGTGRFAVPLGVRFGLDPAIPMLKLSRRRGILAVQGLGESLPFKDESFDFVQIVFVIEFVDHIVPFLREAVRTIRRKGDLILGFIDRDSSWGQYYARESTHRENFHPPSPKQILMIFQDIGLEFREAFQTLFQAPAHIGPEEEPLAGFGKGGFVVFAATKKR